MDNQKKGKKKLSQPVMIIFTVAFLILTFLCVSQIINELQTKQQIDAEYDQTEETIKKLNEELESLQNEKEKLTDPNYVNAVARSKYNLTKVGEEVYSLEALED